MADDKLTPGDESGKTEPETQEKGKKGKRRELLISKLTRPIRYLQDRIALNRFAFRVYSVLRAIVLVVLIRCLWTGSYELAAICILSLVLFLVPAFLEETWHLEIPPLFEVIIYVFIFAAEILGEIGNAYIIVPGWDTMLHTLNGFLCAAVGFSLVDLLNRTSKRMSLSPVYLMIVAFCFSMTIGVLWEFFEFAMDYFLHMDMQKDFIITSFGTTSTALTQPGTRLVLNDIVESTITLGDGTTYVVNGYLDTGIRDTMKDLIVNFIGAVVFDIIGFLQVTGHINPNILSGLRITPIKEGDPEPAAAVTE